MITVGLTGGIASGKSSVARLLRSWGIPVVDADQVARDVVAPGEPALAGIVERFGAHVLQPDGTLDRPALRAIVTANPTERRALERITHPRIAESIMAWLRDRSADGAPVAVVEAALMVETGSYRRYDHLLVVACSPEAQLERLLAREPLDEATARRWLAAQLPLGDKTAVADAVVWNDGLEASLQPALEAAWNRLGLSRS